MWSCHDSPPPSHLAAHPLTNVLMYYRCLRLCPAAARAKPPTAIGITTPASVGSPVAAVGVFAAGTAEAISPPVACAPVSAEATGPGETVDTGVGTELLASVVMAPVPLPTGVPTLTEGLATDVPVSVEPLVIVGSTAPLDRGARSRKTGIVGIDGTLGHPSPKGLWARPVSVVPFELESPSFESFLSPSVEPGPPFPEDSLTVRSTDTGSASSKRTSRVCAPLEKF